MDVSQYIGRLPSKAEFMAEFHKLGFGITETYLVETAFDVAMRVHSTGPKRRTGEAYIWHPVRAALNAIRTQLITGVRDYLTIIALLLHDCIEEAEKSHQDQRLVRAEIAMTFQDEMCYIVQCCTKNKLRETGYQALGRIARADHMVIPWCKEEDRGDNLSTETREVKLVEYEDCFPAIYDQHELLIERHLEKNNLTKDERRAWRRLVPYLRKRNDTLKDQAWERIKQAMKLEPSQ
jgi:putative cell wall-binding protein